MKLIITNAIDIFGRESISCLIKKNILEKVSEAEYLIDLPMDEYPRASFSINDYTLYSGLQWIGTLSQRADKKITVHLNSPFAAQALAAYIKETLTLKQFASASVSKANQSLTSPDETQSDNAEKADEFNNAAATKDDELSRSLFLFPGQLFFSLGTSDVGSDSKKSTKSKFTRKNNKF